MKRGHCYASKKEEMATGPTNDYWQMMDYLRGAFAKNRLIEVRHFLLVKREQWEKKGSEKWGLRVTKSPPSPPLSTMHFRGKREGAYEWPRDSETLEVDGA